jgi:hypothetical protein
MKAPSPSFPFLFASSSAAAAASATFSSIPNLPLRGISEFHISAYKSPYYDEVAKIDSMLTMNVDPNLVVDFVIRLFGHGKSTGLRKIVLSDIFTGCSSFRLNDFGYNTWRELDTFSPVIGRIWGRCTELEEVRLLGFGIYDLGVKVWKRSS